MSSFKNKSKGPTRQNAVPSAKTATPNVVEVTCTCGKIFKNEKLMLKHKRYAKRHSLTPEQTVKLARGGGNSVKPSVVRPVQPAPPAVKYSSQAAPQATLDCIHKLLEELSFIDGKREWLVSAARAERYLVNDSIA